MTDYDFKSRSILIAVTLVTTVLVVLFGGLQPISWAAPDQHPNQQTIPPRPTNTPVPTPTTTTIVDDVPTPEPGPTDSPESDDEGEDPDVDNDVDHEDDIESLPETPPDEPVDSNDPDEGGETTSGSDSDVTTQPTPDSSTETTSSEVVDDSPNNAPQSDDVSGGTTNLEPADLSLTMQVDNLQPVVGETITLTLVISNSGPNEATAVVVNAPLSAGLAFQTTLADAGVYDFRSGLWQIDQIRPQQSLTLTLNAFVAERGTIIHTAEVVSVTEADPDSAPNNQVDDEDDQASLSLSVRADLDLADVSNGVPQEGETTAETPPIEIDTSSANGSQFLLWLVALIIGGGLVTVGLILVKQA